MLLSKPFKATALPEYEGHTISYSQYGNKNGEAVVVLHGGPGSKSKPKHAHDFDLEQYHVILSDQRGCGESTPGGEIKNNTTEDLIADIERLREALKIDTWFVAGGSWGSTLSLAYAQAHPDRVRGLLLSSIFLARQRDMEWSFSREEGVGRLFPDVWERRLEFLKQHGADPQNAAPVLLDKLTTADETTAREITAGVYDWEGNLFSPASDVSYNRPADMTDEDISSVTIFLHYEMNEFFFEPEQLIKHLDTIAHIPAVIVHGRHDVLCPLDQMWVLTKAFNSVETVILPTSGHKLTAEGEIAKRLAFAKALDQWICHDK